MSDEMKNNSNVFFFLVWGKDERKKSVFFLFLFLFTYLSSLLVALMTAWAWK